MSKRQTFEDDEFASVDFEENEFFFDYSDSISYCSDEEEDAEIHENLVQLKIEEEQREKDLKQTQGLQNLNISKKYSWRTPVNNEVSNDEEFPGLLRRFTPPLQKTGESIKLRKGAGFTNRVPEVFFGSRTGISVKLAICSYFLQGRCTRPNCAYYHPVNKKCKFDTTCTNPKCVFVHSSSENKTSSVQPTEPQKNKPQNNEKCKHRICLNTFQIVENKVVATQKTCKHGDNCNFAHTIKEIATAIQSNEEKFKCNYGHKCKHVSLEISKSVIKDKPTKIFKYQNKTEFCECPRVHTKESIQDFIVRVHTGRRPPPKAREAPQLSQKNNV